MISGVR